jgi:phosphatidylserine decarboxylase precursor-related protein
MFNPFQGAAPMHVHREGRRFIAAAGIAAVVAMFVWIPLAAGLALLAAGCALFFRDPERMTPVRDGLVVSAADGRIVDVGPAVPPPELQLPPAPRTRISVFLSIFDVHINRAPVDGTVLRTIHTPGRFRHAADPIAGEANERRSWLIETADGQQVVVVQVAGLVARRIVAFAGQGQQLRAGERLGLIRFGSRTDVYLPEGVVPLVAVGQRAVGGETVFADRAAGEPARRAEPR